MLLIPNRATFMRRPRAIGVCVCVGDVRAPDDPDQESSDLVIDVADLSLPIAE